MRYPSERAQRKPDLAILLKVCPHCLGDLVAVSDFSGDYYSCLQCDKQVSPRTRVSALPPRTPRTGPVQVGDDFFPGTGAVTGEVLRT